MTATVYQTAFDRFAAALPDEERAARAQHLQRFLQQGFPGRHAERWRYTDLSALNDRTFEPAVSGSLLVDELKLPRTDRLVYVNGRLDREQSTADELNAPVAEATPDADSLDALNRAFALPGLVLRLGRNAGIARVLHVIIASTAAPAPAMSHQRHRIELGELAQAHVVLEFRGSGEGLQTQVVEVSLAAGARLKLDRVQHSQPGTTLLTRINVRLDRDSQLDVCCVDGGAGLVRHDLDVDLAGPGAEVSLDGFYLPAAGGHIDNHTTIVHRAPHGRSRERFKGIVDARARAVFNGRIVVQPGAQKTDSEQQVANLLLSKRAEVDAKPELEIYADDVKCAHGATVGQLDHKALAYLRSRGIDAETARSLLLQAFAVEVLDQLAVPALRQRIAAALGFPADNLAAEFAA